MGKPERIFTLTNLDTSATKDVIVADSNNITERHFRSLDYNSVLRTDTIPLKFPRDGGRAFDYGGYFFILDAKEVKGVKTNIQLDIKRRNPFTNDYDLSFTGVLEFNPNGSYRQEDEFIYVKVVDSRKLAKFKERDEIEYDVLSNISSDNITVTVNSYIEALYKKIDVYLQSLSNGAMENIIFNYSVGESFNVPYFKVNDVYNINEIGDRLDLKENPDIYPDTADVSVYSNTLDVDTLIEDILISGDINVYYFGGTTLTGTPTFSLTFKIGFTSYDSDDLYYDDNLTQIIEITTAATTPGSVANVSFGNLSLADIEVKSEGRLDFEIEASLTVSGGTIGDFTLALYKEDAVILGLDVPATIISKFSFYEKTLGWEDNDIRGLYAKEALENLIALTTSETDTSKILDTTILDRAGLLGREFVTNGFQLRQFVDRSINVSFKDLFKSLSAISPIGLWYDKTNDIFKIEDIEEFYKPELFPINLGEGKDIKTTDFRELYFNTILSGYPETEYEDFNGVNEVNTETEHEISIEVKKKYNKRSPYYGDSKGKELARRKNISKYTSEDTKYDKQVSLTTLDSSDETIQGDLSNLSGYKGVDEDYNLWKTPRQNLQRQSPLLLAPIYKDSDEIITFRNSVKDTNITYTDPETGNLVNEFDNILQAGLRARLVDPELDDFEGLYTEDIANEIFNDPHRIMPYKDKEGNDKYGYIWDIEGNRISGKATYKLIKCNPNRVP